MKFFGISIGIVLTSTVWASDLGYKDLDPQWVRSLTQRGGSGNGKIVGSKKDGNLRYIGMPVGGIASGTVYLGGD